MSLVVGNWLLLALGSAVAPPAAVDPLRFVDVTAQAGIVFHHQTGAQGDKWLPECLGSGVAVLDFDGDGWMDLFLVNGRRWQPGAAPSLPALYRNLGDGRFEDWTVRAGLAVQLYGLGAAVADTDGDGWSDLYLTALEGDRLFRNRGDGSFRDATAEAGLGNADFGVSAAFFDADNDLDLDLFVANYVRWDPAHDRPCVLAGDTLGYCTPQKYPGVASKLYRNLGNGRFEDRSVQAGVADPRAKSLGVTVLDFDDDGALDLFVANDTEPNRLYRGRGDGTFVDVALETGVAFSDAGVARGGMGTDAADWDGSGHPGLAVGNFAGEMLALYARAPGGFVDRAPGSTVGIASRDRLSFGLRFFDADLDGDADLVVVNGHLDPAMEQIQPRIGYRQLPLLLLNQGNGSFVDGTAAAGLTTPWVGRGLATLDFDRDGDLDLVVTENGGPAHLLRNDVPPATPRLTVRLRGRSPATDALGTRVQVGRSWARLTSGSSYASASEPALTFGLSGPPSPVILRWPQGRQLTLAGLPAVAQVLVVAPSAAGGENGPMGYDDDH